MKDKNKKPNKFALVMKKIFVDNIGWKALALVFAVAVWVLAVGL